MDGYLEPLPTGQPVSLPRIGSFTYWFPLLVDETGQAIEDADNPGEYWIIERPINDTTP